MSVSSVVYALSRHGAVESGSRWQAPSSSCPCGSRSPTVGFRLVLRVCRRASCSVSTRSPFPVAAVAGMPDPWSPGPTPRHRQEGYPNGPSRRCADRHDAANGSVHASRGAGGDVLVCAARSGVGLPRATRRTIDGGAGGHTSAVVVRLEHVAPSFSHSDCRIPSLPIITSRSPPKGSARLLPHGRSAFELRAAGRAHPSPNASSPPTGASTPGRRLPVSPMTHRP